MISSEGLAKMFNEVKTNNPTKNINTAIDLALNSIRPTLPIKTGNMAYNATERKRYQTKILIEIDDKKAPYAKYLNNPNWKSYRFWDKSVKHFLNNLTTILGGTLEEGGEE